MVNDVEYKLPCDNYISIESDKEQIVIGNTFNHDMRHVIGWLHRNNGKYKKTAAFTIDLNGVVYKHFEPKYQSNYFNNKALDKKTIVILIENDGWLVKDNQKNEFITWFGDIYNQNNGVIERKWRGHTHWASYREEQVNSTVKLVTMLCKEFSIPLMSISHNTKLDDLGDYKGILYKSNLDKHYTDLSPSWDCKLFNNKLELI